MSKERLLIIEIIFSFVTLLFIILNFVLDNPLYITIALLTGSVMLGIMAVRRFVEGKKVFGVVIVLLALFVFISAVMEIV
ncbi:hypothetical protein [Alkalibacillus aidingensis]|uniref:hypothetical protein n=1 Tax=Alkalibacillus aidingensis TaxID=2747607 RepID=UPI0016614911|nr:hypothetical protein [Alkalibacillus aidingensis]